MALDDVNIGNPLYADPTDPVLPATGFALDHTKVALVVVDPQIDFLSPEGVSWPYFGESITENGTVDHLRQLFEAAKAAGLYNFFLPEVSGLTVLEYAPSKCSRQFFRRVACDP